jgi:hypothetical protein
MGLRPTKGDENRIEFTIGLVWTEEVSPALDESRPSQSLARNVCF